LGIANLIVAVSTEFLTSPSALPAFVFDPPDELVTVFHPVLIPTFPVPRSCFKLKRAAASLQTSRRAHKGFAYSRL
jgi:hypothetical protein